MRNSLKFLAVSTILAMVIFTSCKKGDTGPAGPQGEQGPQGTPGAQGPKGDTGVANVIYSDWLDVQYGYVIPTPGDTTGFGALIDAPKLTEDIMNKGEVRVYVNINTESDPVVTALPYLDTDGILINSSFFVGGIQLFSNVNASTTTFNGEKVLQYRYVLIPGGVLGVKPDNVHLDNYKEVQSYLKLKD